MYGKIDNDIRHTKVILKLKDEGIKYLSVYYCGGGDSGAIEEYYFYDNTYDQYFEDAALDAQYNKDVNLLDSDVHTDSIDDLLYPMLNNIEDWWNNDGGYGYMTVNLDTMEYKIENNTHYTQTDHHSHEGKLEF